MMMCLSKWLSATVAIAVFAGAAAAADTTLGGKIKSTNPEKKTFVVTTDDKDNTFSFDDQLVVNRDGKETKSDLKVGDSIAVCYDKGLTTWTAHYILVQEGKSKKCDLIQGNVKGYDADKKELSFTNLSKQTTAYSMGKAPVRLNMEDSKIEDVKIGDNVLIVVEKEDGKEILRSVMVKRTK
jgi:Cu/Ag efflux protein CusF